MSFSNDDDWEVVSIWLDLWCCWIPILDLKNSICSENFGSLNSYSTIKQHDVPMNPLKVEKFYPQKSNHAPFHFMSFQTNSECNDYNFLNFRICQTDFYANNNTLWNWHVDWSNRFLSHRDRNTLIATLITIMLFHYHFSTTTTCFHLVLHYHFSTAHRAPSYAPSTHFSPPHAHFHPLATSGCIYPRWTDGTAAQPPIYNHSARTNPLLWQ